MKTSVEEILSNFLAHASSKYYDPVKAHEYYLRTRELKGRQSGKDLKTEKKKQAWAYSKQQIKEARTAELDAAKEQTRQDKEELRSVARSYREELSAKLKTVIDKLSDYSSTEHEKISEASAAERERISSEVDRKIAALPEIPKGISKERRAELAAERKAKIAKIRGDAKAERSDLTSSTKQERAALSSAVKDEKNANRQSTKVEKEKLASDLKATITKAKEMYDTLREEIKAKYEAELQTEYDAIKKNV